MHNFAEPSEPIAESPVCRTLRLNQYDVVDLVDHGHAYVILTNSDGSTELIEVVDDTDEIQKLADLWRHEKIWRAA